MSKERLRWSLVAALCVIQFLYYVGGNGVSGFFSARLLEIFLANPLIYFDDYVLDITKKLSGSVGVDSLGQYSGLEDIPGSVLSGKFFREIHLVGLPVVLLVSVFNGIRRHPESITWLGIWTLVPVIFLPVFFSITGGAVIVWGMTLIAFWRMMAIRRATGTPMWQAVLIKALLLAILGHLAVFLWLVIEIILE